MRTQLSDVTLALLLPLFFAYSGLNTRLQLLAEPWLLGLTAVFLLAACLGKGVACSVAMRLRGHGMRDSLALGALMNARGLILLVFLNIGLEYNIITPALFASLVIAAVLTTMIANPLFLKAMGAGGLKDRTPPAVPVSIAS